MKNNKIWSVLSKFFLIIFVILLVFSGLLVFSLIFDDNSNSLNSLINIFLPITIFCLFLFIFFRNKSKKNNIENDNSVNTKKKKYGKKIIYFFLIFVFALYLVFLILSRFEGVKIFFSNGGHFNETAGYNEFPELLKDINK